MSTTEQDIIETLAAVGHRAEELVAERDELLRQLADAKASGEAWERMATRLEKEYAEAPAPYRRNSFGAWCGAGLDYTADGHLPAIEQAGNVWKAGGSAIGETPGMALAAYLDEIRDRAQAYVDKHRWAEASKAKLTAEVEELRKSVVELGNINSGLASELGNAKAFSKEWETMAKKQEADVERLSHWGRDQLTPALEEARRHVQHLKGLLHDREQENRKLRADVAQLSFQVANAGEMNVELKVDALKKVESQQLELEKLRKTVAELSDSNLRLVGQRDDLQASVDELQDGVKAVRDGAQHQINRLNLKLANAPYSLIAGRWVGAGLPPIYPGPLEAWACNGHAGNTTTAALARAFDQLTRDRASAMDATVRAQRKLGREQRASSHKAQAIRNLQIRLKAQLEERAKLQRELSTERKLRQAYELTLHGVCTGWPHLPPAPKAE